MTYGQIRSRLSKMFPAVDLELIDGWISDRYTQILDRLRWQRRDKSTTVATVATQDVIKLPVDCRALRSIRGPLGPLCYWDATKHIVGTVPGTPQAYRPVWDSSTDPPQQQLQVWPVPDDAYTLTVEYTAEESTFASGDDTSVALLPWLRPSALVSGVEADCLRLEKDYNGMATAEGKYEGYIRDMVRTEALRTPARSVKLAAKYDPSQWGGESRRW